MGTNKHEYGMETTKVRAGLATNCEYPAEPRLGTIADGQREQKTDNWKPGPFDLGLPG